ncbi:MAG: M20 metallopeptidase family protein [Pyramidobacter sp.]|jgi:amidohydrolase
MDEKAQTLKPWLSEIYRSLHRIPELGRDLPQTIAFIESCLDDLKVPYRRCAGGILAQLSAGAGKPVVALRADMDALPLDEATGLPWASRHAGKMHACGHDAHVTCALGALKLLSGESALSASLRVLFQPDEEGDGGAAAMIADGALESVSAALGLHVSSEYPVGTLAALPGRTRASSDMFTVVLHGRGCHGAYPQMGVDTVAGGAQIVGALQTLVSRETDPLDSVVLTIGHFEAGRARNVIPERARFDGIIRTLTPQSRERSRARFKEIVSGMAAALRMSAEITVIPSYPPIVNDRGETAFFLRAAASVVGESGIAVPEFPKMGVDDFAYLAEKVPGCYAELGCRGENQAQEPLHNPRFYPDEGCLPVGAAAIAAWVQSPR